MRSNREGLATEAFKRKLTFLEDCIAQKAGHPTQNKNEKNYTEKVWQTSNGLKIELEKMKNSNRIRMVIYKTAKD